MLLDDFLQTNEAILKEILGENEPGMKRTASKDLKEDNWQSEMLKAQSETLEITI